MLDSVQHESDFVRQGSVLFDFLRVQKAAMATIGERILEGGVYRHYRGGLYTTVCEALVLDTETPVVVYRDEAGKTWTRPTQQFFWLHSARRTDSCPLRADSGAEFPG